MDVHKPKHPIETARAFAVEIFTVTVGILIALGLEALVQAAHHRHVADQARTTFREELAENRRQIEKNQAAIRKSEPDFKGILAMIEARVNRQPNPPVMKSADLNTPITTLTSAAWDDAQATAAFSYLKPEETRALASTHADVQAFQTLEAQALQAGVGVTGLAGDPNTYDPPQLRDAYRVVSANYAYLQAIDGLEVQMLRDIDTAQKALKD